MGIADYQITIFVAIVVVTFLFGRAGMFIAVVTILVWTFSMVFTKTLMTIQIGTILGATITGFILRQLGGYGLLIAAIIGIGVLISNSSNNSPTSNPVKNTANITNNNQNRALIIIPDTPQRSYRGLDPGHPATSLPASDRADGEGGVGNATDGRNDDQGR